MAKKDIIQNMLGDRTFHRTVLTQALEEFGNEIRNTAGLLDERRIDNAIIPCFL